ncbi:MAG: methyltransferase [Pseudomonadota bacterium]
MSPLDLLILACYASLVLELTVLHTPSVASSRRLWLPDDAQLAFYSPPFRRWFALSPAQKTVRFVLPLVIVYAVFLYPLGDLIWGPEAIGDYLYAPGTVIAIEAATLMIAGRALTLGSVFALRRYAADDHRALQTRSIFRWSRNPGLVGMYVMFVGFWLVMPSLWFALGILVYVLHMHAKVRLEEDYLGNRFGADFMRYRDRTPRYLL